MSSAGWRHERWFHRRRSAHKPPRMADHNPSSPFYFTPRTWHGTAGLTLWSVHYHREAYIGLIDAIFVVERSATTLAYIYVRIYIPKWLKICIHEKNYVTRRVPKSKKKMRMTCARSDDRSSQIAIVSPLTNSGELPTIMSPTCSPGWHESVPFNDDESSHKIGDNLAAITLRRPNNYVRAIRF